MHSREPSSSSNGTQHQIVSGKTFNKQLEYNLLAVIQPINDAEKKRQTIATVTSEYTNKYENFIKTHELIP